MPTLRILLITGMMLIGIMSVSACGKKPPYVDPPSDVEDDVFLRQSYPDPATNK